MKFSQISKMGHVSYELTMLDSNPTLWLYDLDPNYPTDKELIALCVNKSEKRAAKKGKKNAYWMSVAKLEDADDAIRFGHEVSEKKAEEKAKAKTTASSPKGKKGNGKAKPSAKPTASSPKGKKNTAPVASDDTIQTLKGFETRLAALEAEISPNAVEATITEATVNATAEAVKVALEKAVPAITEAVLKALAEGKGKPKEAAKKSTRSPKGNGEKKAEPKSKKTA